MLSQHFKCFSVRELSCASEVLDVESLKCGGGGNLFIFCNCYWLIIWIFVKPTLLTPFFFLDIHFFEENSFLLCKIISTVIFTDTMITDFAVYIYTPRKTKRYRGSA